MREKIYIFLDDEREELFKAISTEVDDGYTYFWCKTYQETIDLINKYKHIADFVVDFDHDLGEEKTGYDVAKYIVENQLDCIEAFEIHSYNPVGRDNIKQLLMRYGYKYGYV